MNLRALLLASTIAFTSLPAAAQTPVDVELVLAIDASGSVDEAEHQLQRDGYIRALTSKRIVQTIQRGAHGRIALTAFEWSAQGEQQTILPWVVVETPKHAAIAASFFQRAPRLLERASGAGRTAIGAAVTYARGLFEENGFRGDRRIIDISGDGTNNNGPRPAGARDGAVEAGIIINAVVVPQGRSSRLITHYRDEVVGGAGSFAIEALGWEDFERAILQKLVLEIAAVEGVVLAEVSE